MKSRAANYLAGASLAFSVLAIALWVGSYHRWREIDLMPSSHQAFALQIFQDDVELIWRSTRVSTASPGCLRYYSTPHPLLAPGSLGDFEAKLQMAEVGDGVPGITYHVPFDNRVEPLLKDTRLSSVTLPAWGIAMTFAIWPVIRLTRHFIRKARRKPGHCICGYDLRATPDRCPECGRNRLAQ